ncbi:hypothetical protein BC938DRAFT_477030, partial [Jimgerdemannia flammicorona]
NKEHQGHYEAPAKVQYGARERVDLQLGPVIEHRVEHDVEGRGPRRKESTPPPVVVLGAQVEVAHQDRHLRARQNQDAEDKKEEACSMKMAPKGNTPPMSMEGKERSFLEPKVRPDEAQRHGDEEPEANNGEHGAEGDSARRLHTDEEEIEEDEAAEDDAMVEMNLIIRFPVSLIATHPKTIPSSRPSHFTPSHPNSPREQECCQEYVVFPRLATEHLVDTRRDVASNAAKDHVEDDHDCGEGATGNGGHEEELGAVAEQDGEEHAVGRGAKHVAVNELPAEILLDVLL